MALVLFFFPLSLIVSFIISYFITRSIMRQIRVKGMRYQMLWNIFLFISFALLITFLLMVIISNSFDFGR